MTYARYAIPKEWGGGTLIFYILHVLRLVRFLFVDFCRCVYGGGGGGGGVFSILSGVFRKMNSFGARRFSGIFLWFITKLGYFGCHFRFCLMCLVFFSCLFCLFCFVLFF